MQAEVPPLWLPHRPLGVRTRHLFQALHGRGKRQRQVLLSNQGYHQTDGTSAMREHFGNNENVAAQIYFCTAQTYCIAEVFSSSVDCNSQFQFSKMFFSTYFLASLSQDIKISVFQF